MIPSISQLITGATPDIILNRHCPECEFQQRCKERAIEKDELSLLPHMSEKERKKLHEQGIFTVTQLSHTFRPRRRRTAQSGKGEKYHHSLKALAIRTQKIHVVGHSPPNPKGTPVYLDVESLPERDFYYLIGIRLNTRQGTILRSFWANTPNEESAIWKSFLEFLAAIENPVLIHYGTFEATFLKRMCERYGKPPEDSPVYRAVTVTVNLLSFIHARIYFPTVSNGLKEIGKYLGLAWTDTVSSGIQSILLRNEWDSLRTPALKESLLTYNMKDCEALEAVSDKIGSFALPSTATDQRMDNEVVDVAELKREHTHSFKRNRFLLPELDAINQAAYWDYQREKIYLRSSKNVKRAVASARKSKPVLSPNKTISCPRPRFCPKCHSQQFYRHQKLKKTVVDLRFMRHGLKRWIVDYEFARYQCATCGKIFSSDKEGWTRSKFGPEIVAFAVYQIIELRLPQESVADSLNQLFGYNLSGSAINDFKAKAAEAYSATYDALLTTLAKGSLVHADETQISVKGVDAYVWVFANMEEVVYVYRDNRESEFLHVLLESFTGVLVSDFYPGYEGLKCNQQKCLVHLIRDLNDALFKNPYDDDLKWLVRSFAELLNSIVKTIDLHGLKCRFLRKHLKDVDQFFRRLSQFEPRSELALKCKSRFVKNRNTLFTFLNHDGIPWNNNNAEHAVKPFAMLRRIVGGVTSTKGINDYLILLSICETCHYKGVNFLDFLRSGEKDIDAFANRRGHKDLEIASCAQVPVESPKRKRTKTQRRRCIKNQVVSILKVAQQDGLSIREVSEQIGFHYHIVKQWFYTTGKTISGIKKVAPGRFVYREGV